MGGDSTEIDDVEGELQRHIKRLGEALSRPPATDEERRGRVLEINLLMSEIDSHGIDGTALVRYGMSDLVWLPVMILLIATPESARSAADRAIDFDGWLAALGLAKLPTATVGEDLDNESIVDVSGRAVRRLPRWVELAPIDDLIALTPPSLSALEEVPAGVPSEDVTEIYRWLWERSGRVSYEQWSAASLRLEFQWREGTWVPPFPARSLRVNRTTDSNLHREIAVRFVASPLEPQESDLLWRLQEQAIQFLAQARWAEAAALFEFYLQRAPDNCIARNNLGFCLLPQDAEVALTHLEGVGTAADINRTMLAHNICTALALSGRHPEALDRAEYHWQRGDAGDRSGAYLWKIEPNGPEIYNAPDLRLALAELGLSLARQVGTAGREKRWAERVAELSVATAASPT